MRSFPKQAGAARLFVAVPALALIAASIALSVHGGSADAPGAGGRNPPLAAPAANAGTEAEAAVRRLRAHLERQPRDARAWVILARTQFEMEHFADSAQAYEKALALPSKVANDAAVWCEFADALGMTRNGKLAGRPRELINRALALDPNHPKALEMAGSAEYAQGDYAAALRFWQPLLGLLVPGSQLHRELAAAIARTERLAAAAARPGQRQ